MAIPVPWKSSLPAAAAAALFTAAAADARRPFDLLHPGSLVLLLLGSALLAARALTRVARPAGAPRFLHAAAATLALTAAALSINALSFHSRNARLQHEWREREESDLERRAARLRAEFAGILAGIERPIARARDLATQNPRSGAPSDSEKAFNLLESLSDARPSDPETPGLALYGPDQVALAWNGASRALPHELIVLSIPEGATKCLTVETDGLSRLVALSRPWKGSGVLMAAERVIKSVYDTRILAAAMTESAIRPDLDRIILSDYRKPPVSLNELFDQQGDLLPGPETGRPFVHVALRAPDGAFLGYATLAGRAPMAVRADLEDWHHALACWLAAIGLGGLVGASLLPRAGAITSSAWHETARQGTRIASVWLYRFILLKFPVPITLGGQSLADPALFSRAALGGLLRSPQDALLTSMALLITGLLVSLGASRLLLAATARRKAGARICLLLALLIAFLLGMYIPSGAREFVHNSRVDILTVNPLDPEGTRVALQLAAAFSLLGFMIPLTTFGWCAVWAAPRRRGSGAPPPPVPTEDTLRWVALLLAPCTLASCAILELALQPAATQVLMQFLRDNLAPIVRAAPTFRRTDLLESISAVKDYPAVAERIAATDPGGDPTLAYDLWEATPLATKGYAAALTVIDPNGSFLSRFSRNFPPILERESLEGRNLPPDVISEFEAGPRGRRAGAFHLDTGIARQGELVGIVSIHLLNDFANIPPLTPQTPLQDALGESRQLSPLLGPWARTVGVVVYDAAGVPVPPSPRDPPPAPPESARDRLLGDSWEEYWRTRSVPGGRVHDMFFSSAEHLVGLSFLEPGALGRAARALKLSAQTVIFLIVLMVPWGIASAFRLEWRLNPARLIQALTRTHYRRLITTFLMASIAPLSLLAFGLTEYLTTEIEEDVSEHGWTILESALRQVEDFSVVEGVEGPPDDAYLFNLSENIGGDELSLYLNGEIRATSDSELYAIGALPDRLEGDVYKKIAVEGHRVVFGHVQIGGRYYRTVSGAISLGLPGNGILSVLLTGHRGEVERRAEEVYDSLLLTTASVVFIMSVLAYVLARGIAAPIRRLSAAAARIALGDLDAEVSTAPRDETGDLVASFNAMARALRKQRDELEQRGNYIEKILLNATTGVLSVDARGRIVTLNPAAVAILGLPNLGPGQDILSRLSESRDCEPLLSAVRDCLATPSPAREVKAELGPAGEERQARGRIVPFTEGAGLLVFLDDVTETVRSNRLAAWAEMARRIAHEIKNPLTPIQLSADHLRRVFADGSPAFPEVLEECLRTINEQVANLRGIAAQFSHYARLPEIRKEPTRMREFLEEVIRPYHVSPPRGVSVECDLDGELPTIEVDRSLLAQAMVNLIENALQAMPDGGRLMMSATTSMKDNGRCLHIIVADTGVGMDRESLARAFEPYFSTKVAGTGLGMAIARRAIEEHRGRIDLTSAPGQGTTARITLPVPPAPSEEAAF